MKDLQKEIKGYLEERNWENKNPANYAKSISIEAAELLEHFQWGEPSIEDIKADPEKWNDIQKELADVFIYALDMATILDLDAAKIIRDKMEHNKKKYPIERVKGNRKEYLKIKKEYRAQGK